MFGQKTIGKTHQNDAFQRQPLSERRDPLFADRQGSVIWVTEPATGDVVAAYEYDGYGQTQGALLQPYGYTGREYDAESGLYYYRARAYDPANGVFLQSDPIGFAAEPLGLYNYVSNDPYSWSDPEGLTSVGFYSLSTVNEAQSIQSNSFVFSGIAALAGMSASALFEVELFGQGTDISSIPNEQGICSAKVMEWFDSMKTHPTECGKGKASIGPNLMNMRKIQTEIYIRTLELAMCFEGGARGDAGHPERISRLFSYQKYCVKYIKNAVSGIGTP